MIVQQVCRTLERGTSLRSGLPKVSTWRLITRPLEPKQGLNSFRWALRVILLSRENFGLTERICGESIARLGSLVEPDALLRVGLRAAVG